MGGVAESLESAKVEIKAEYEKWLGGKVKASMMHEHGRPKLSLIDPTQIGWYACTIANEDDAFDSPLFWNGKQWLWREGSDEARGGISHFPTRFATKDEAEQYGEKHPVF